jgi:hypothetical protein
MTPFPRAAAAALVLAGLWLAASHSGVRAQSASTPQQPQLLLINEVSLKPETAPEWAELQKNEVIPAQKKAGTTRRDVWANGPGGDPYLRSVVTPISSIAQFDSEPPMVKALGQEAAAALAAKGRRLVSGSRSRIVMTRPELSFGTRPAKPNIGVFSIVNVTSGRAGDFEALVKSDVIPGLKKAGVTYYSVVQTIFGGDANEFWTLSLVPNYAELAKGSPLERGLGPEGMAKLTQKAAPVITRVERRIIRYLADLSFGPASPTSH